MDSQGQRPPLTQLLVDEFDMGGGPPPISNDTLIDGQQPSEKTSLRRLSPTPGAVSCWAGGTNRFDRRRGRVMAIGQSAQHGVPI